MNKKWTLSLFLLAFIGFFWACGDGPVETVSDTDVLAKEQTKSISTEKIEKALKACKKSSSCKKKLDALPVPLDTAEVLDTICSSLDCDTLLQDSVKSSSSSKTDTTKSSSSTKADTTESSSSYADTLAVSSSGTEKDSTESSSSKDTTEVSSSSVPKDTADVSSSSEEEEPEESSSSSAPLSSSSEESSSSQKVCPDPDLPSGTCAPNVKTAAVGDSVIWTFTPDTNSCLVYGNSVNYAWVTTGMAAQSKSYLGRPKTRPDVYVTAGEYGAFVTVKIDSLTYSKITCSEKVTITDGSVSSSSEDPASSSEEPTSSESPTSSAAPTSSDSPASSSSSETPVSSAEPPASSSSEPPLSSPSSSATSSSSVESSGKIEGTCGPRTAAVDVNASVYWSFTAAATSIDVSKASFVWTMVGANSESQTATGPAAKLPVKYATAGEYRASAKITVKNESNAVIADTTINCSSVIVGDVTPPPSSSASEPEHESSSSEPEPESSSSNEEPSGVTVISSLVSADKPVFTEGVYEIMSCDGRTGTLNVQIDGVKKANCWYAFDENTRSEVAYWNNSDDNCSGQAKITFPTTLTVLEGLSVKIVGACWQ
ncbi:MAG: hypothetical protein HUK21_05805 [Fibrobacteraceae bacterium]|nr:hypothetical protein [Fibrobacteraceae bacterium]